MRSFSQTPAGPTSTKDLLPDELELLQRAGRLHFGRIESIPIRHGQPVFAPWAHIVQNVKFGAMESRGEYIASDFELKQQFVELFQTKADAPNG